VQLHLIDWVFIVGYCVVAFGIGVYFSKRAGKNIGEFFVAGRNLPWWLAGTSIVATTFASDTPLVVSAFVRQGGIYKNWFWWSLLMGGMLTVFFYARLWRRAGVITDVELIELRYEGRSASVLRGLMAVYGGVLQNSVVMGWVILAMIKISTVMLGLPDTAGSKVAVLAVLLAIAVGYTTLSGFWGVVMTDFIQFIMAMSGSVALAGIVLWKLGGPGGMVEEVSAAAGSESGVFRFIPDFSTWDAGMAAKLLLITFVLQVTVQWWGGGQGGGYLAQRLFATRSERDSVLAALWFNFAHYVLRSWPWLVVGLASLVYFPLTEGEDPEMAYPKMIAEFLPIGLRGLMVASMLAAFMSTIDTQINWGASYLVNDLYKRFIKREASDAHYVKVSRVMMIVIMAFGAFAAWQSESIEKVWIYLATLTAGAGFVGLLRWYWWRVNAWAEISALAGSFVIANGNHWCKWLVYFRVLPSSVMDKVNWLYSTETYSIRLLFIIVVCTAVWVSVMYITRPVGDAHLERFYRRVRPGGWWRRIAERCPDVRADRAAAGWIGWFAGVACVYLGLFGVGHLCLARPLSGVALLAASAGAGWLALSQVSSGCSNSD